MSYSHSLFVLFVIVLWSRSPFSHDICLSLNNQAPSYTFHCLTVYTPNRNLRSSSDNLQLKYPLTRTQAGDITFTVAASKEWNNLPVYIRKPVSVNTFKKALKTLSVSIGNNIFIFCFLYISTVISMLICDLTCKKSFRSIYCVIVIVSALSLMGMVR